MVHVSIAASLFLSMYIVRLRTAFVPSANCLHGNQVVHAGNAHLSVHSTCTVIAFNYDMRNAMRVNDFTDHNGLKQRSS